MSVPPPPRGINVTRSRASTLRNSGSSMLMQRINEYDGQMMDDEFEDDGYGLRASNLQESGKAALKRNQRASRADSHGRIQYATSDFDSPRRRSFKTTNHFDSFESATPNSRSAHFSNPRRDELDDMINHTGIASGSNSRAKNIDRSPHSFSKHDGLDDILASTKIATGSGKRSSSPNSRTSRESDITFGDSLDRQTFSKPKSTVNKRNSPEKSIVHNINNEEFLDLDILDTLTTHSNQSNRFSSMKFDSHLDSEQNRHNIRQAAIEAYHQDQDGHVDVDETIHTSWQPFLKQKRAIKLQNLFQKKFKESNSHQALEYAKLLFKANAKDGISRSNIMNGLSEIGFYLTPSEKKKLKEFIESETALFSVDGLLDMIENARCVDGAKSESHESGAPSANSAKNERQAQLQREIAEKEALEAERMRSTSVNSAKNERQAQLQREIAEKEALEAERMYEAMQAREEAERIEAEQLAKEEANRITKEEAARIEAERLAKEEAARIEAERLAKEEADQLAQEEMETERMYQALQAKEKADQLAKEEAVRIEAERLAEEEAERVETERTAKQQAERTAKEEADRIEAEQIARIEAEQIAKEEADRIEAERAAKDKADRIEAERLAKEEAERSAAEEAERIKKRIALKKEAGQRRRDSIAKAEADRLAKENAALLEAERLAEEKAAREAAERLFEQQEAERIARVAAERSAKTAAELNTRVELDGDTIERLRQHMASLVNRGINWRHCFEKDQFRSDQEHFSYMPREKFESLCRSVGVPVPATRHLIAGSVVEGQGGAWVDYLFALDAVRPNAEQRRKRFPLSFSKYMIEEHARYLLRKQIDHWSSDEATVLVYNTISKSSVNESIDGIKLHRALQALNDKVDIAMDDIHHLMLSMKLPDIPDDEEEGAISFAAFRTFVFDPNYVDDVLPRLIKRVEEALLSDENALMNQLKSHQGADDFLASKDFVGVLEEINYINKLGTDELTRIANRFTSYGDNYVEYSKFQLFIKQCQVNLIQSSNIVDADSSELLRDASDPVVLPPELFVDGEPCSGDSLPVESKSAAVVEKKEGEEESKVSTAGHGNTVLPMGSVAAYDKSKDAWTDDLQVESLDEVVDTAHEDADPATDGAPRLQPRPVKAEPEAKTAAVESKADPATDAAPRLQPRPVKAELEEKAAVFESKVEDAVAESDTLMSEAVSASYEDMIVAEGKKQEAMRILKMEQQPFERSKQEAKLGQVKQEAVESTPEVESKETNPNQIPRDAFYKAANKRASGRGNSRRLEPAESDILDFAIYLGIDPDEDREYFWVAEECLYAPLPKGWCEARDSSAVGRGDLYYWKESDPSATQWEHPLDPFFRSLFQRLKAEKEQRELEEKLDRLNPAVAAARQHKRKAQRALTRPHTARGSEEAKLMNKIELDVMRRAANMQKQKSSRASESKQRPMTARLASSSVNRVMPSDNVAEFVEAKQSGRRSSFDSRAAAHAHTHNAFSSVFQAASSMLFGKHSKSAPTDGSDEERANHQLLRNWRVHGDADGTASRRVEALDDESRSSSQAEAEADGEPRLQATVRGVVAKLLPEDHYRPVWYQQKLQRRKAVQKSSKTIVAEDEELAHAGGQIMFGGQQLSPEDVHELAGYLNIQLPRDAHLIWIAKLAALAPIPDEWRQCFDEEGDIFFASVQSFQVSRQHPLDRFFALLIYVESLATEDRRMSGAFGEEQVLAHSWLQFIDDDGDVYYYNFFTNKTVYEAPVRVQSAPPYCTVRSSSEEKAQAMNTFRDYLWEALELAASDGGCATVPLVVALPSGNDLGQSALVKTALLVEWLVESRKRKLNELTKVNKRLKDAIKSRNITSEQLVKHFTMMGKR